MKHWIGKAVISLTPLVALLIVWQIVIPPGSRTAFLLSRPSEIFDAGVRLLQTKAFWSDLGTTSETLISGYIVGSCLGFVAGISVWYLGRRASLAETYLLAVGSVPIFAVAPLFIFVFGIGATTRFMIVAISVFIPMALGAYYSAVDIERRLQPLITSLDGTRKELLSMIVGPGAFYMSIPTLKPAANAALVAVFLAEWISSQSGLAKFILASMSIYDVPDMWVGLATFVLLGVGFMLAVNLAERVLTPWRRGTR